MTEAPQLSAEDTDLILKFRALLDENGGALAHDMDDPEHVAFVKLMHNVCGNHEDDFPGLHRMLSAGGGQAKAASVQVEASDGAWETTFAVPEVGFVPQNQLATAKGYGTVVGGFQVCNLSTLVLAPNGSFLATGSAAGQLPLNTLGVETGSAGAHQIVPGSSAMMTYSYRAMDGTSFSGTVSGYPTGVAGDPVVVEPKQENGNTTPYNRDAICIGLGRPTDLTGCDYTFAEPTQDNPIGRLPLVGNVTFNYPIKPLAPTTNFSVVIQVIRTDNGGQTTLEPTDLTTVYENFYIEPGTPNQLSWNLPMKANRVPPEPDQPYTPVVFSNIPWATEMVSYLTVNIMVTLDDGSQNGKIVVVTIQSVPDGVDSNPVDGVTYIKAIEFVWHCLGEDTEVVMADGSTRAIKTITAGDAVRTGDGKSSTVTVTHNAPHAQSVHRLETDRGQILVASAEHLIFTTEGPVPARELKVGAQLVTADGPAGVISIDEEDGGGRVLWNLSLGEAPQLGDDDPEVGQFYANGILVGDARATRALRHRRIADIDWVKSQLPEEFHRDVDSTFRNRTGRLMV